MLPKPYSDKSTIYNSDLLRSIGVIVLLLVGLMVVYVPRMTPQLWGQQSLFADGGNTYITDLDFWRRTDREKLVVTKTRFDLASDLNQVPLTVGDWHGQSVPETNKEVMILLDPEQYVQRLYQNSAGQYLWLSMIGGRSSQPFHAPDICYDADGWQFNTGSHPITLSDGSEFYGYWLQAHKQMPGEKTLTEHVVYYFYLFPHKERVLSDGIVLFKLTSSPYGTLEETLNLQADFIRQLFTRAY
jgi:hypothetical protein